MSLTFENINKIIGCDDSFKMPAMLMKIMFDKKKREKIFCDCLEYEHDLSFDWFHIYFQEEYAERKTKKQDFTPNSLSKLLAELTGDTHNVHDTASGTGGLVIQKWNQQRLLVHPAQYYPSNYFYQCEELSDRSIPFLLFNLLIRGMNAIIIHGDALNREVKQVYFIQNDTDDFMKFSSLNVMPHSEACEKEFHIKKWLEPEIDHIESPVPEFLKEVISDELR